MHVIWWKWSSNDLVECFPCLFESACRFDRNCCFFNLRLYQSRTTIMICSPKHLNCKPHCSDSEEAFGMRFMFLISFSPRFQHLSTLWISRLQPAWIFMIRWVFHNNYCPSRRSLLLSTVRRIRDAQIWARNHLNKVQSVQTTITAAVQFHSTWRTIWSKIQTTSLYMLAAVQHLGRLTMICLRVFFQRPALVSRLCPGAVQPSSLQLLWPCPALHDPLQPSDHRQHHTQATPQITHPDITQTHTHSAGNAHRHTVRRLTNTEHALFEPL